MTAMDSASPAPAASAAPVAPAVPPVPTDDLGLALGLQALGAYDMVIDARSPREYGEDHLPAAINLPVVDSAQYAVVGTLHKVDRHRAYLRGVADSLRNMADAIDQVIVGLPADARILVYCFRGGKRSRLWHDALRTIGFRVDLIPGGWKRYRAVVREQLSVLPGRLRFNVLAGATGTGKTRLLAALDRVGEQVLDLEGLANHRGSLIGALPGVEQPSQKYFDSLLLARLLSFDPARPVWIEAESKKIGAVQLPDGLYDAMHRSRTVFRLDAPMAERVRLWHEDFGHFARDPASLLERLRHLIPLIGNEEFGRWQALAEQGHLDALFERLMVAHYDPTYQRSSARNYQGLDMQQVALPALDPATLAAVAATLAAGQADSSGDASPR